MRWKKLMSGVLAGAVMMTSVVPSAMVSAAVDSEGVPVEITAEGTMPDESERAPEAEASEVETVIEEQSSEVEDEEVVQENTEIMPEASTFSAEENVAATEDGLVAEYSFENGLENSMGAGQASVVSSLKDNNKAQGFRDYTDEVTYKEGKTGQAIQLGDYGLKLNEQNLGDNFTVSMWLKPDGTLAGDQSVLFLGYHAPEKWFAVAGNKDGSNECRIWSHADGGAWNTFGTMDIGSDDWHLLTLTGNSEEMVGYLDGEKIASEKSIMPLTGDNQDIYIGVTNWDDEFTGLVDDVKVYNKTLAAGQVYQMYDNKSAETILQEKGITATDELNMVTGRKKKIEVTMPPVVAEANPVIAYESSNKNVVTVDNNGEVTAVGGGTAAVTVSVSLGETTKTAVTSITVEGALDNHLVASYSFDGDLINSKGDSPALPIVTRLGSYNGDVQYSEGKNGQAIRLGDYGLQLNQKNLGTDYTVSAWLKPDGTLGANQSVLFMGYHDKEKWLGIAGENGTNLCKVWTLGGQYAGHTTLFSPTIDSINWHNVTITGEAGKATVYLDGVNLGTKDSNDPLVGENQDIYLGVNNWDPEFTGLMDEVKVYKMAMTEEEVQSQSKNDYTAMLQSKLENAVTIDKILGKNQDAQNIKYNLNLPKSVDGVDLVWSSTNDGVIAADGTVVNPADNTDVSLTATLETGTLTASTTFELTAVGLDRAELDTLIKKAKAIEITYCTEVSTKRMTTAITEAETADSYSKVDAAYAKLSKAISGLVFKEEYVNPFDAIDKAAPATRKSMEPQKSEQLFTLPEAVKDMVTVEYRTSDENTATYVDGQAAALKEGKVSVTAIVTAKYNDYKMEYSTALNIKEGTPSPNPDPNPTPNPNPSPEPSPNPTPAPDDDTIIVTPDVTDKGDGNIEVTIPDVPTDTPEDEKDVIVELPKKELQDTIRNSEGKEVNINVKVPDSISNSDKVNLEEVKLPKEALQAAKDTGKNINVTVNDSRANTYSWSFSGKDVDENKLTDVNLKLEIKRADEDQDVNDKLHADEKGIVIDFAHKGDLPTQAAVTIDAQSLGFKAGDKVTLYYYNDETGKLVSQDKAYVVGPDGKVTIEISHCSKYVIKKTTAIKVNKVTGIKLTSSATAVRISWKKQKDAAGYRVYRYNTGSKKYVKIADVKGTSYTDKGLKSAAAYRYAVRAYTKASKTYYSAYTGNLRVLTKPSAPASVKGKRTSKVSKNTSAQISFKKSARATAYRIYKYNKKTKKYTVAYRVKNNVLYKYDASAKKYKKAGKVISKSGRLTCKLTGLNLKSEKNMKFVLKAEISKSGYKGQFSSNSKTVTIK